MADQSMIFHFLGLVSTTGNLSYNSELYYQICPMFRNSGEILVLALLGSGTHLCECRKEHFLGKGNEGVYFPEEGAKGCTGENNRHLQWKVYNKGICNIGSVIRLSGSNICPLRAIDLRQGT